MRKNIKLKVVSISLALCMMASAVSVAAADECKRNQYRAGGYWSFGHTWLYNAWSQFIIC